MSGTKAAGDLWVTATVAEAKQIALPGNRWRNAGAYLALEDSNRDDGYPICIVTGMGTDRARLGLGAAIDALGEPRTVVGFGIAGALSPRLSSGDVIVADRCFGGGRMLMPSSSIRDELCRRVLAVAGTALLTESHLVATPGEKAGLHAATGADAVDMESASWASVCVERRLPWGMIRTILDTADESIPETLSSVVDGFGRPVRRAGKWLSWIVTPGNIEAGWRFSRRLNKSSGPPLRRARFG